MRSMPLALGWEMARRGRWGFILTGLSTVGVQGLFLTIMRHYAALDPADRSTVMMSVVFVEANVFIFGTVALAALAPMPRLYTYPVSTASLAGWSLTLGTTAVAIGMFASITVTNAIFDLDWPVAGPVLFAAAACAALQAVIWLADKSAWLPVVFAIVFIPLCLWFHWHHGPPFRQPAYYWREVTAGDVFTLLMVAVAGYVVGVFAIARNRCGTPPYSIGLLAWLGRVFAFGPETALKFRDPIQAQLWFEWRKKGLIMPAIVGTGLFMGAVIWLLANRDPNGLYEGCVVAGALLALGGLMGGFGVGNVGSTDADIQIGQFFATRPLTTPQMSGAILKTVGKSVVIGWLIWAIAFVSLHAILLALHVRLRTTLPAPLGWWYVPAALLAMWTTAGILVPLALTGRMTLILWCLFGSMALAFVLPIGLGASSKNVLLWESQEYREYGLAAFGGIAFLVFTIWAFTAARRRSLVCWQTVYFSAAAWVVLCALAAVLWTPHSGGELAVFLLIAGLLALAVSPLASAPLALAWNRTR